MCPNLNLLRSYKVYPRLLDFNYMKDRFYLYIYLDPFKELSSPLTIKIQGEEFCFAYTPIYLGKGTGAGYRHNQHVTSYLNTFENNQYKKKTFDGIHQQMSVAAAKNEHNKPHDWKEYQKSYIIILKTFETAVDLLRFETEFINKLGTQFDKTGPLSNKIKTATKYDFANSTGNGRIL